MGEPRSIFRNLEYRAEAGNLPEKGGAVVCDLEHRAAAEGSTAGYCPVQKSVARLQQLGEGEATIGSDTALKYLKQGEFGPLLADLKYRAAFIRPPATGRAIQKAIAPLDQAGIRVAPIVGAALKLP